MNSLFCVECLLNRNGEAFSDLQESSVESAYVVEVTSTFPRMFDETFISVYSDFTSLYPLC